MNEHFEQPVGTRPTPDERDIAFAPPARREKILVAIASYGVAHLSTLREIVASYRRLPMEVDIVVLSEAPKDLGSDVEVVVGLPAKNPWTLPFAHKSVFAQRVERYDLFIYSEDDIVISERQIRAFLRATPQLAADEIAGFLRYEVGSDGDWFLTDLWGHFHWQPASVRTRGDYTVAEFTNEHAGFYILTQAQLQRALASGGFLRAPYRARYNWPETAATDPYTSCGFRKVICISALEDFLVHHASNRYVHQLPVSLRALQEQIATLNRIRDRQHPASTLCEIEPKAWRSHWKKTYFEPPQDSLLQLVPPTTRRLLSIGCGWGATERTLKKRGVRVTALPLDSIVGAALEQKGIEVIYGSMEESFRALNGRAFDCVLLTNLLHLQKEPLHLLQECIRLVTPKGTLLVGGPNFNRLPWLFQRTTGLGPLRYLRSYEAGGVAVCGPSSLGKALAASDFQVRSTRWVNHTIAHPAFARWSFPLGPLTARDWLLKATRNRSKLSTLD